MNNERFQQAEDLTLRVEKTADLAALIGSGSFDGRHLPEPLDDFLFDAYDHKSTRGKVGELFSLFRRNDPEEDGDAEELAYQIMRFGLLGVVLKVATPVKSFYLPEKMDCSYSWGHYHTAWEYGHTYEDAWSEAMQWAKKSAQEDKVKSLKEKAKKKGGAK